MRQLEHGNRLEHLAFIAKRKKCNPAPACTLRDDTSILLDDPHTSSNFTCPSEKLENSRLTATELSISIDRLNIATPQDVADRMKHQAKRYWELAGRGRVSLEWRAFAKKHRHLIEEASKNH